MKNTAVCSINSYDWIVLRQYSYYSADLTFTKVTEFYYLIASLDFKTLSLQRNVNHFSIHETQWYITKIPIGILVIYHCVSWILWSQIIIQHKHTENSWKMSAKIMNWYKLIDSDGSYSTSGPIHSPNKAVLAWVVAHRYISIFSAQVDNGNIFPIEKIPMRHLS